TARTATKAGAKSVGGSTTTADRSTPVKEKPGVQPPGFSIRYFSPRLREPLRPRTASRHPHATPPKPALACHPTASMVRQSTLEMGGAAPRPPNASKESAGPLGVFPEAQSP